MSPRWRDALNYLLLVAAFAACAGMLVLGVKLGQRASGKGVRYFHRSPRSCPGVGAGGVSPKVRVVVHNNVPQQSNSLLEDECWTMAAYEASCDSPQNPNQHRVNISTHEEYDTQQSFWRYYDIIDGEWHKRGEGPGTPHCEHNDYQYESWFSLAPDSPHTSRIEQWDNRTNPATLANWLLAEFHPEV